VLVFPMAAVAIERRRRAAEADAAGPGAPAADPGAPPGPE
jgi:hypothetical protein